MRFADWVTLEGTRTTEREFYWLWILATTAYGVGDVVTTIALVEFTTQFAEANPIVAFALYGHGLPGLIAVKLGAFFGCLAISVVSIRAWNDRYLYALPPLVLLVVGSVTTILNLRLLVG